MEFVVTLIASEKPLTPAHIAGITRYLDSQGMALSRDPQWLAPHKAVDLFVPFRPHTEQIRTMQAALVTDRIDILITRTKTRRKRLLLADMDATIVAGETLDELAARAGHGESTAAVTAKAMRGEIDFVAALHERVALLKGLPETVLRQTLDATALSPGADALVDGMRRAGAVCVLVSGGFTFFTAGVAERTGFHHHHGNTLEIKDGALTGRVIPPVLDREAKLAFLNRYASENGLSREDILAIGDGANDLSMLQAAGLGIGYRPKPVVAESLDNLILYGDLGAALYAQGLVPAPH